MGRPIPFAAKGKLTQRQQNYLLREPLVSPEPDVLPEPVEPLPLEVPLPVVPLEVLLPVEPSLLVVPLPIAPLPVVPLPMLPLPPAPILLLPVELLGLDDGDGVEGEDGEDDGEVVDEGEDGGIRSALLSHAASEAANAPATNNDARGFM